MSTDAIVMLREDHRRMRRLIRAYRTSRGAAGPERAEDPAADTDGAGEIVTEFLHELTVHAFVENEVVYPRVRLLAPDTTPLILEFREQHHVAEVLAGELADLSPGDEAYAAKARVLMDLVGRHMDAEEEAWFPQVRRELGRTVLQAVGTRMAEVRERAPQRPKRPLLHKISDAIAA
ncbi:hemerythrin domain-containing protein [Streptomyces bambusae]|uniref:hemerythrin domain-containing protein n=1 Tax=Streptomyces bambusae TaxID=1550616 RepID=UPI001CFF20F6|nr:hemerythrin domain-containing protein [Streptomyces bambusae]MCB5164255.1 hemerythrin domain-containing protein [Streptomyces bambusae]